MYCRVCDAEIDSVDACVDCGYYEYDCKCDPRICLWRLLVPQSDNDKNLYSIEHHEVFDKMVMDVAGGITILRPSYGKWIYETEVQSERMIPVEIACTRSQIREIAKFTKDHYDQKQVFYYLISSEAYFE